MTATRDPDRLIQAFLEEGPAVMTDRVLDAIREDVDAIDQRAGFGPWRTPLMNRSLFAAAVVFAAVVGGLAIYTVLSQSPNVGPPPESSTPVRSSDDLGALPPELNYPFLGQAKQIEGMNRIDRGDLYFEDGIVGYDVGGRKAFNSVPTITSDGDLRLTSAAPGNCAEGDEGTYAWSLSPGGTILTIEAGTDDCAMRAAVIPGTYERAACRSADNDCLGPLEAGHYASHYFEPRPLTEWAARHGALSYTVPAGWASYADWPGMYGLTPLSQYETFDGQDCYDCAGERDLIAVLGQPGAATEDCLETNVPGVGFDRRALLDWLLVHPGLEVTPPDNTTIGGFPASSVIIEASEDWTGTCDEENPFSAVPIFFRLEAGYHWALNVGERYHVTLIDIGDGNTVAILVDSAEDEDLETLVETARPIIESFEFPPR